MQFTILSAALTLALAAPVPAAPSSAVLVARAVGPDEWRLESRPGGTLRNIKLLEGQTIILIDEKGTREIKGPGELLLLSKGIQKDVPLFAIAFRALTAPPAGDAAKAGVRGTAAEALQKSGWEQLVPRTADNK